MCGRFALYTSLPFIKKFFNINTMPGDANPSYNIAPTHEVLSIINHEGKRLGKLHWGLVPSWSKDLSGASKLINARVETVRDKPSFKNLLKGRRCAVIADGFFEWKKTGQIKEPYYIHLPSGNPFAFAGLWDMWKSIDGTSYNSCTIITTEASPSVSEIHNRMPVILKPAALDIWLNPDIQDSGHLEKVLQEGHEEDFSIRLVSKYVNSPKNNDEKCVEEEK